MLVDWMQYGRGLREVGWLDAVWTGLKGGWLAGCSMDGV